jgi:hypothetical protein
MWFVIVILVTVGCSGGQDENSISIPEGSSVMIDGILEESEWSDAYQGEFGDESELFLMHKDGYLYLGIRGAITPVTSVCISTDSEVRILHSSAALGSGVYQQGDDGWVLQQDFTWSNRDTSDSPQAQADRKQHLTQEGWLASTGRMGASNEVEYQISMPAGLLQVAAAQISAPDYSELSQWPADLEDACVNLQTLQGPLLETAEFKPDLWKYLQSVD